MNQNPPPEPHPTGGPPATWQHRDLYDSVISALYALPDRFTTALHIEGVPATDLFTMNSALGAAIETSVVDSLNGLREMWDPQQRYADYRFVRQSQRFPDVLLTTDNPAHSQPAILLGIELKGWFLLSKEGEPSFRYKVSADCCNDSDLLVVVPWAFDSVISGKPKIFAPIVKEAAFAAHQRNHHWEWVRANPSHQQQSLRGVTRALHAGFYPSKSNRYLDSPNSDSGGNFGRIARCGVMNDEIDQRLSSDLLGIPVDAWRQFLKIFVDGASEPAILGGLQALERMFGSSGISVDQRMQAADLLAQLADKLRESLTQPE